MFKFNYRRFVLPLIIFVFFVLITDLPVVAQNIDGTLKWAWSPNIGWIDFANVTVQTYELTGTASSSVIGIISLNCSNQNRCASTNYKVNNSGTGALAGWAWNENIGWISFCGNASMGSVWSVTHQRWFCPANPTYQVIIDGDTGDFFGWAWSASIGWISFNCEVGQGYAGGGCTPHSYCFDCGSWGVKTFWTTAVTTTGTIISPIYDSQITGGIAFNTLRWVGSKSSDPTKTAVWFQIASSQCPNGATNPPSCTANIGWGGSKTSGSGAFVGPQGTAGEEGPFWYQPDPNVWIKIDGPAGSGAGCQIGCPNACTPCHNNSRYFRYRMRLVSYKIGFSPRVDEVTLSWSP